MSQVPGEPSAADWDRQVVIRAMLGEPFHKRAPLSKADWEAMNRLASFAETQDLGLLLMTPISRVVQEKNVPTGERDIWFKAVATAVLIGTPPGASVHAVVLDSRDPRSERVERLLSNSKVPYALWHGPERVGETLDELFRVADGGINPCATTLLNWAETNALHTVHHGINSDWTEFDFISESDKQGLQRIATGNDGSESGTQVTAHTKIWTFAEMALASVVAEANDPGRLYAWQAQSVRDWMSVRRKHLLTSSLDLVVFPDGPYEPPLFAIEVDGHHHDKPDQKKRDRLKDEICEIAGIPLVRVRVDAVPSAPHGIDREAAERIRDAKSLLPTLISVLCYRLVRDREHLEPKRKALAEEERTTYLRALERAGLGVEDLVDDATAMAKILTSVREDMSGKWQEYEFMAEAWSDIGCGPLDPQLTDAEIEKWREDTRALFREMGCENSDVVANIDPNNYISGRFHMALGGLSKELRGAGWELGDIRFVLEERGTRALLDLTRIDGRKVVPLSAGPLRLSGVATHVDLRDMESTVAALCVMYAARSRVKSGR